MRKDASANIHIYTWCIILTIWWQYLFFNDIWEIFVKFGKCSVFDVWLSASPATPVPRDLTPWDLRGSASGPSKKTEALRAAVLSRLFPSNMGHEPVRDFQYKQCFFQRIKLHLLWKKYNTRECIIVKITFNEYLYLTNLIFELQQYFLNSQSQITRYKESQNELLWLDLMISPGSLASLNFGCYLTYS